MNAARSDAVLAEAAALDAVGDHDEAINVLARAAQQDDMTAMIRLAKRLLVGDRAPYLPRDAARLAVEAANKRNAEAVALLAVFQCTGILQRKSWEQALKTLALAAALGWQPAREQLVLLAEEGEPATDADLTATQDPAYWSAYPDRIDLGRWFTVPAGRAADIRIGNGSKHRSARYASIISSSGPNLRSSRSRVENAPANAAEISVAIASRNIE